MCGVDNAQASSIIAKPIESLTESEYRNQFVCPEDLASEEDKQKTIDDMLKWMGANNKKVTPRSIVDFRMDLLTAHNCKVTLQNIAKHTSESERFTQVSADTISRRFNELMKKSGMSGVIPDLQKCYTNATANGNDIEGIRACYFYDKMVMGMDLGFRDFMKEKGNKDPGPTSPYLSDDSFHQREQIYLPIAFPQFTNEQIRVYYSDAKANLQPL